MPQIYCNNHAHAAHAVFSSSNAAVRNATATPSRHHAPRSGHMPRRVSLLCRSAATPTNQPEWRHKAKPEARRLAGRSGKCSRAVRSSAGHICFMDWCRDSGDTRFTCHCCDIDGQNLRCTTIGFLLAGFKWDFLCLTNHIVTLRLEKTRLESEQEPPFGGTKRARCLICSTARLRTIS